MQAAPDRTAIDIAQRLLRYQDHPVNLPPELVQYAREEARRVGISERLMLMILWQEQQWYQNLDSGNGAASGFGHFFNWVLRKTIKSDKSLGITHIKLGTLRDLIRTHHLTADQGRDLNSYSELAKTLEVNEKFAITITAFYLSDLQHKEGDWSDKQIFYLYAADSDQVREANRQYGDSTEDRKHSARGLTWAGALASAC